MNEAEFYGKNYGDQEGGYPRSPSDDAKAKFNKLFYYSFKKILSLKTSYMYAYLPLYVKFTFDSAC